MVNGSFINFSLLYLRKDIRIRFKENIVKSIDKFSDKYYDTSN